MKLTFELVNIEAAITGTREAIAAIIRYNDQRADLSQQGRAEAVRRALDTEGLPARVEALGQLVGQVEAAPDKMMEEARAGVMPKAGTAEEAVAAELEAARRMARDGWADNQATGVIALEPSPARTIMLEEAIAAGKVTEEAVDALTGVNSEEVRDLRTRAGMLRANHRHLVNQLEVAQGAQPRVVEHSLTATVPVSIPARRGMATTTRVTITDPVLTPTQLHADPINHLYRRFLVEEPDHDTAMGR